MSERMIELQRAKLLGQTPPLNSSPSTQTPNSTHTSLPGSQPQQVNNVQNQSPEEAAVAQVLLEDSHIERFIHRLQRRNDSHPTSDSFSGTTVPTALSRRALHRQGVGYLDDTVAAVISASADRFLATVLQQGIACRDQRLKGSEMAKEAARRRKRHMQHYDADTDDRKRRKEEAEKNREGQHLAAIAAAEALKKGGKSAEERKKKKAKKPEDSQLQTNGSLSKTTVEEDDDEESYDSIDEEEEYYQKHHDPDVFESQGKAKADEDEDDDTLQLRDLARPLEAWRFHLTGKEAVEPSLPESDDESDPDEYEDKEDEGDSQGDENGNEDSLLFGGMVDGAKSNGKQGDDSVNAKRKTATSPAPSATS
eukprot:scaffold1120_cov127-Cylindrotheca_fusiformis.AAC.18